jgi:hypothetical protein
MMARYFSFPLVAAVVFSFATTTSAIDAGRSLYIEGYTGAISYAPGDELALHLSSTASECTLSISRVGAETTAVLKDEKVEKLLEYPVPETASAKGCNWPVGYRMKIPADWKTGYYEVRMKIRDSGGRFTQRNSRTAESTCYFVLRAAEPGKNGRILLQLATHTYNAYNNWGGSSLYGYHGRAGLQGHEVSYARPPRSQ